MEGIGIHTAGISGGEVLIGYVWYVLLRIFANHDRFRLR
jgi:hypothetical protein